MSDNTVESRLIDRSGMSGTETLCRAFGERLVLRRRWRFGILAAVWCVLTLTTQDSTMAETHVAYSVLAQAPDPCHMTPAC